MSKKSKKRAARDGEIRTLVERLRGVSGFLNVAPKYLIGPAAARELQPALSMLREISEELDTMTKGLA